jgi:Uma2 family endonuclease
VYGYGCPYRIENAPDTLLYYDASIIPARLAPASRRDAFIQGRPVLAVEVVDLSDTAESVRELLQASIDAGVQVVWAVEPELEVIDEFRPGAGIKSYVCGDEINLSDILPGFRCPVHKVFE